MADRRPNNAATGRSAGQPSQPPFSRAGAKAFTLIEVLVVIFILGVLATIVASVAGYVMNSAARRETAATQKIVLQAVQAYYDAGTPKAYPDPSAYMYSDYPSGSGRGLVNFLTGQFDPDNNRTRDTDLSQAPPAKAATEVLMKLPQEAWSGNWNEAVKDGWGIGMRYIGGGTLAGFGGKPVVISAGSDGRFGEPSNPSDPNGEDDVRSDESQ